MDQNDAQENLELKYSKYQLMSKLREEFSELTEDKCELDAIVQIYLHRQAAPETLIGTLTPKHGTAQEVAYKLAEAVQRDLIDFDEVSEMFIVKYDIDENTEEALAKYQYPLPMVHEPCKVEMNHETGYRTIRNNIILNGQDISENWFEDKDLCLDHINRVNSVPLSLDMELVDQFVPETIARATGEDFEDFLKRRKQKDTFYNQSVDVMSEISDISDVIYLTHRYDRRGRCYASGYHVNYQGDDYHKAVLQLAEKEVIQ